MKPFLTALLKISPNSMPCFFEASGFPAIHGITTKKIGNFGLKFPESAELDQKIVQSLGADCFWKLHPTHGISVLISTYDSSYLKAKNYQPGDGLIFFGDKNKKKPVLMSNTADCPIILLRGQRRGMEFSGIVHSGWRGTQGGIVITALEIIFSLRFKPTDINLALWPGICAECYSVGEEFNRLFPGKTRQGKLNLALIIKEQIASLAVPAENIHDFGNLCSFHSLSSSDENLFFSHRRGEPQRNLVFLY